MLWIGPEDRIAGYGIGGFDAASVDRGPAAPRGQGDWWIAETTADPATATAYVLTRQGPCRMDLKP